MSNYFFALILSLLGCSNTETKKKEVVTPCSFISTDTCVDFNSLNNKIRDGLITKDIALQEIQTLLPKLKTYFYKNGGQDFKKTSWVFPVEGSKSNAIGGTNGSGYIASGYDYFDGNKHGGHAAHDIFIIDKNQDCLDDSKKKSVNVLSMTGGIVIATETVWDTTSNLRGGKYIWIYDPSSNSFFYYAHNSNIIVRPSDIIKPGNTIATVGRTGLNAFKKRSPTHLHIMQLKLDDKNYPRPINCYKDLTTITTK